MSLMATAAQLVCKLLSQLSEEDPVYAEWRPSFLMNCWTCSCQLVEQDQGSKMRQQVRRVMFPLAFHLKEVLEFPELVERLPHFVELTNEEREDFFAQPSLFYVSCYTIGDIGDANLRNISLYFICQFGCLLSIPHLSSLIQSFDVSEATIRIVSVLTHCVRKNSEPGPGNPAYESIKSFFTKVHESMPQPNPFVMPTIWLFLAKAIPLIFWEPNAVETCSQFASWVIGLDRAHPVHISMATRLLHALYNAGWTVPGQLIPQIVR